MPSEQKYVELFKAGCKLAKGLIQLDGQEPVKLGFFDKRKLEKSRLLFEQSTFESPENAAPYLMLAKVAQSLGKKADSLNYLLKAWDLEPANLILTIELSGAYGVIGKYREAISVLEVGAKYYPNEPRILFNLGVSYLLDSRPQSAVDVFLKTVEIEPDFAQNHKLLKYSQGVADGRMPIPRSQSELAQYI